MVIIAKTVLSRLGNDRAGMVGMSVIDRLCNYFNCQPGELFVFVPEREV
ncbi:MAG: helix-turn-helix transcriptional regulator [Chloroflexi bacterium]|nr:helix-turn-helix transcriptional regulator [Chloroflexota bacterium]MCH8350695.1 helix-turn-helix transcriptional regulator [Chloroflexota bacterium]MCI0782193.1 helix-turn-helix transcriptional regulator [Chloroflexota bacterium]MCI0787595.1 helix-turn-helix transcriptional regulator [Chloroflexota bacterium]MCI0794774.1 helix-turn-helix transcriptional regulator [Chloroflexota bacterium]